jgi:hypothetical protein
MPRNDGTLTFVRPGKELFREVRAGYLVTVIRGGRERPLVWRPPEPLPIDRNEEWEMHWMPEGLSARQFAGRGDERRPRQIVPIPERAIDTGAAVALFGSPDSDRPDFAVRVQRLRPILSPTKRPPLTPSADSEAMAYLFSGAGDAVYEAVAVRAAFSVTLDDRQAVQFVANGNDATLIAFVPGFQCRIGEHPPQELPPNVPLKVDLSQGDFLELRFGRLWWHLTTVLDSGAFVLGPEDAPAPDVERERRRWRRLLTGGIVATFVGTLALLSVAPPAPKPAVRPATTEDIRLKPPKPVAPAFLPPMPESATRATRRQGQPALPGPAMIVEARRTAPLAAATPEPELVGDAPRAQRDSPSIAETIHRAVDGGGGAAEHAGRASSEDAGNWDPRVRSPRQQRRRRAASSDGSPMRLTLSGTGQLERADVEAALERHLAQFQRCYVNALDRNADARGVVRLEWTIARSGGVSDVVVLRSDIADDTMLRCIDEEVRRVRFPQPVNGAVRVQYPFVFRSLGD